MRDIIEKIVEGDDSLFEQLIKKLEKKRQNKNTGLRPSALSASQDVSARIKMFHDQVRHNRFWF